MKFRFVMASAFLFCNTIQSQNTDIEWLYSIQKSRIVEYNNTFKFISSSVYPVGVILPLSCFSVAYIKKDTFLLRKGIQSLLSLSSNLIVTTIVKYTVNRTRPYDKYTFIIPLQKENTPSFPSGHTSLAFNIATYLSYGFPKWYVIVPSFVYASSVAYSRLYLGVHYPSDVLAGAFVGALSAYLSCKWYEIHINRKHKNTILKYD